jgi:predicted transglutaminase-like cysteine proteinase
MVTMRLCFCLLLATGLLLIGVSRAERRVEPGFTAALSERTIDVYERRFAGSRRRIANWRRHTELQAESPATELKMLLEVNAFLNQIRFVEDAVHWGTEDYWATPAESVGSNGADCEDFSIAKYFLLKELGVPVARLRLTYVKAVRLNQAHMVLAYYARPGAEPLVLDNLEDTVRPASERSDLTPVYSFNDEELWLESRGRSGSPSQIRNWNSLLERLREETRS